MNDLETEWNQMLERGKIPIFEIELTNGEYELIDITMDIVSINKKEQYKLYANSININTAICCDCYFENNFTLDYYLDGLYENCYDQLTEQGLL